MPLISFMFFDRFYAFFSPPVSLLSTHFARDLIVSGCGGGAWCRSSSPPTGPGVHMSRPSHLLLPPPFKKEQNSKKKSDSLSPESLFSIFFSTVSISFLFCHIFTLNVKLNNISRCLLAAAVVPARTLETFFFAVPVRNCRVAWRMVECSALGTDWTPLRLLATLFSRRIVGLVCRSSCIFLFHHRLLSSLDVWNPIE